MRHYYRFNKNDQVIWAEQIGNDFYPLIGSIYDDSPEVSSQVLEKVGVTLLTPFHGNKVIALAYNYKSLVGGTDSFDEPLVFLKYPESVIPTGGKIQYPEFSNNVWIEAELTIVVGKSGHNISVVAAPEYILGYTCGNDVTAENISGRDWHLARSKAPDTFCPLGPGLVKDVDTSDLRIESFINGKQTQCSRTSDRVMNDFESLSLASRYFTLRPGDVILTGTPAGATDAIIRPGDKVDIRIENIGELSNTVG